MTAMQVHCDRCGENIETDCQQIPLQCGPRPASWPRDPATSDPAIVLCKPCFDELCEWFVES